MKNKEELKKYDTFIYKDYRTEDLGDSLKVTYYFEIPNLTSFEPTISLPKKKDVDSFVNTLVFNLGMVELISYWKCCMPKNVKVLCGSLNKDQINWFKKLYFKGLGEFFYRNEIDVNYNDFMNISALEEKISIPSYKGKGILVPVGGGKDSCVTLELLKNEDNVHPFIINPKTVMLDCVEASGIKEKSLVVKREIDKNLIDLNKKGFLNGHTPFSAIVAFTSFLVAYLNDLEYIVLSNEASANEESVIGLDVNHQYSKSYEFEVDFQEYTKTYFTENIKYFSLLRPISEYQIGMLFARYKKYHKVFRSCNVGSLTKPWKWCCNCAKCLFVYTILSPFLSSEELVDIFGSNLFENKELLNTFLELLGYKKTKPFDCVGTILEMRYATIKTIKNYKGDLPYLLEFYKNNYPLEENSKLEREFNMNNSVPKYFLDILKREVFK